MRPSILTLALLPASLYQSAPRPASAAMHRVITPLIDPLTELTQKAPNTGKVNKEFNAAEIEPRPRVRIPAPCPPPPKPQPRAKPNPSMPAPKPAPPTPLPEPPKVDPAKAPPKTDLPQMPAPPIPQIQPVEKPKLAFENVSGPPPRWRRATAPSPCRGTPFRRRFARRPVPVLRVGKWSAIRAARVGPGSTCRQLRDRQPANCNC